jgi:molybdopterin/thiamine biosynthesis adenylyltransferase
MPDSRRYQKQILLPRWGSEGQKRLGKARVLVIGAGGLSAPSLQYLVGAGIGTIGIVDGDRVENSNLHRQTLYTTASEGRLKVEVARERLLELNPEVKLEIHPEFLDERLALQLFPRYDLVLDGTDRMETKDLINRSALETGKPWIYSSVSGWEGRLLLIRGPSLDGPCLRCLHPGLIDGQIGNCELNGVAGPLVGAFGSLQALHAIRVLLGIDRELGSEANLISFDGLDFSVLSRRVKRNPKCMVCSGRSSGFAETPVSVRDYRSSRETYLLVDLRTEEERLLHPIPEAVPFEGDWTGSGRIPLLVCRRGISAAQVQLELMSKGIRARVLSGGAERFFEEQGR